MKKWFQDLSKNHLATNPTKIHRNRKQPSTFKKLRIEMLEERCVPTVVSIPGGEGSNWTIRDDFITTNGAPTGGFMTFGADGSGATVEDGSIPGHSDALDGASSVWIDGTQVSGALSQSGNTVSFNPLPISGLNVQMDYQIINSSATLRNYLSLQNPTANPITVTVENATNFGSDGSTSVVSTSSGDTTFTTADRWIVTTQGGGDPDNATVLFGPGNPQVTPSAVSQTVFSYAGTQGVLASYQVTVQPGQTAGLMWFHQLSDPDLNNATSRAQSFFDSNPTPGSDLVAGLSQTQLSQIVNWDFGPFVVHPGYEISVLTQGGPFAGSELAGLAINPNNGNLYVATSNAPYLGNGSMFELWRVTPSGTVTQVLNPITGQYLITHREIVELTWGPGNQIYTADTTGNFWAINPITGQQTLYSASGRLIGRYSLDFDSSGNLILFQEANNAYLVHPGAGNTYLGRVGYNSGTRINHGDRMRIQPDGDFVVISDGPGELAITEQNTVGHIPGTDYVAIPLTGNDIYNTFQIPLGNSIGTVDPATGDVYATSAAFGHGNTLITHTPGTPGPGNATTAFVDNIGNGLKPGTGGYALVRGVTDLEFGPRSDGLPGFSLYFLDDFTDTIYEVSQIQIPEDFGDAPDATGGPATGNPYPTLAEHDGARHAATGVTLGTNRDSEGDGQPNGNANGDDMNGSPNDEDGVTLSNSFTIAPDGFGRAAVNLQNSGGNARLFAWIDFNGDGDWADFGEQVADGTGAFANLGNGIVNIDFNVPDTGYTGQTYARFRVSTDAGLSYDGPASDGEVEDYALTISIPPTVYVDDDWAGLNPGVDPDGPGGPATAFGYDAFAVISDGVDVVANGGRLEIRDGNYNGLNTTSISVTLAAGSSPGLVNVNGPFILNALDTLVVDADGTTPGTGHDQWDLNNLGSASLGGATLDIDSVAVHSFGDIFDIIVDSTNPVTGTFAGLGNGAMETDGVNDYRVFYNPGFNGVRLVAVSAQSNSDVIYVNEDWAGLTPGQDVIFNGGANMAVFMVDAFATIDEAIDAVTAGGAIVVLGSGSGGAVNGNYTDPYDIDKAVEIRFVEDIDANEDTVTIAGAGTLSVAGDWVLFDDADFDPANLTTTGAGTINGANSLSITSTTDGTGDVVLTGSVGAGVTPKTVVIGTSANSVASLSVNDLRATTSISVDAAGSITEDGNDPGPDLVAPTIDLVAGSDIGDSNPVEINAATVDAASGGNVGDNINLIDTAGGIVVGLIDAGSADITLEAMGGFIADGNINANNYIADDALLLAQTNITADITVNGIQARSITGSINLQTFQDVDVVNTFLGGAGLFTSSASDTIILDDLGGGQPHTYTLVAPDGISNVSPVNLLADLDLNNDDETIGSLEGNGDVFLGTGTLTTGTAGSTTYTGVISGSGGVIKVGGTTWTLTNIHTYTGTTRIEGGTLNLTGTLASNGDDVFLVNPNVVLEGSGTGDIIDRTVIVLPSVTSGGIIRNLQNISKPVDGGIGIDVQGTVYIFNNNINQVDTGIDVSGAGDATVEQNTIIPNGGGTGIMVTNAIIEFEVNNDIIGGTDGLVVNGIDSMIRNRTLNNTDFDEQSNDFVRFENFALLGPIEINGTIARYDLGNGMGLQTGEQMFQNDVSQLEDLEDKIQHFPDDNNVGLLVYLERHAYIEDGNLVVIGSFVNDNILVDTRDPEDVKVYFNRSRVPAPNPDGGPFDLMATGGRVIGFGLDLNDYITIKGNLATELFGGFGNDRLTGGDGTDLLRGQNGNDVLRGNRGDDILIGGLGRDYNVGGYGDDIMLSGRFVLMNGDFASFADLSVILDDWVLAGNLAAVMDITNNLDPADDPAANVNERDVLSGSRGKDAYFRNVAGSSRTRDRDSGFSAGQGDLDIDWP